MRHRLLLLRHAKSSWDDPSLPDRDRPLAGRGRASAGVTALIGHDSGMQDLAIEHAGFELDGRCRNLTSARARLVAFVVPREAA